MDRDIMLDTYVFCISEHLADDDDGLLSMWRGYGGRGRGAALVFDFAQMEDTATSALMFGKVRYCRRGAREQEILAKAQQFAEFIAANHVSDEEIADLAQLVLGWLRQFGFLTEHDGFREEAEWRVIYFRERDNGELLKKAQATT